MKSLAALGLLLLSLPLRGAGLPAAVEALLPQLAPAERRLQDASLAHEAARRDAEPEAAAVAEARASADHWWGRWRLRRALGRLKERLDRVEAARVEREAARQELFAVLTGLEEELRGALENALAKPAPVAGLADWWRQLEAWSRRLEALEAGLDDAARPAKNGQPGLLDQARLEQLERDLGILRQLRTRGLLPAGEARSAEAGLRRQQARLRAGRRPSAP